MMKRIALALALFAPMLAAAHDLTPGTFELSGDTSLGFRSGSEKIEAGGVSQTTDTTDYGLSLSGFYYVTPNIGVGAVVDYNNSSAKLNGISNGTSTFLVGPAVALDYPIAPQFSLFGRGAIGYASTTVTQTGNPDVSASGVGLALEAGVKYFLVKSLSFDAGLVYDWSKLSGDSVAGVTPKTTISSFGVIAGLSVYFGGTGH